MPDRSEILKDALALEARDRAALVQEILVSLEESAGDEPDAAEAERLWGIEAQRRLNEYRAGRAGASDAEDVARKAATLLR
jgi:putative addiction module component (TIGR02574 family)